MNYNTFLLAMFMINYSLFNTYIYTMTLYYLLTLYIILYRRVN